MVKTQKDELIDYGKLEVDYLTLCENIGILDFSI